MVSKRGPYLSSTEARRRLLEAGAESAHDLPVADAFVHIKAADVAKDADISKSGVYRNFSSLEELHAAAVVEVTTAAMQAQTELLAEDVVAMVSEGSDGHQLVHDLARLSFESSLADEALDMTVLLAALADHPDIAAAGCEADRAARATMEDVYKAADSRLGHTLRHGVSYEDLAVMMFAVSDGLVIWHQCDPEAVPLDLEGPDVAGIDGPWDPFAIAAWALVEHMRPQPGDEPAAPPAAPSPPQ